MTSVKKNLSQKSFRADKLLDFIMDVVTCSQSESPQFQKLPEAFRKDNRKDTGVFKSDRSSGSFWKLSGRVTGRTIEQIQFRSDSGSFRKDSASVTGRFFVA